MKTFEKDYIKAFRKKSREEEISRHGKLISTRPTRVKKSKKVYKRQKGLTKILYL